MKEVHVSEIKAFLRCRLAWFWSAPPPRGLGLEPVVSQPALHFGRLIHQALQEGYDDPNISFSEAFKVLAMRAQESLCESDLFADEREKIEEQRSLGEIMLRGYQEWAASKDEAVHFLAMETEWHGVRLGRIPLAGRFDALVERSDGTWVLDFKTTSFANTNTDWTTQDLQATTYVHAARQLYGREVRGILFRFLLKKAPYTYDKLILKDGSVTRRKGLSKLTTYGEYMLALAVATLQDLFINDASFAEQIGLGGRPILKEYAGLLDGTQYDKPWHPVFKEAFLNVQRMYYDQIQSLKGQNNFFWEVAEYRTPEQIRRNIRHVLLPAAKEMVSRRRGRWVGPTGLGAAFAVCKNCQFRAPCALVMNGADYQSLLRTEYQVQERYS